MRVLNRSLISVVLTHAKTAHIFLDLASGAIDELRRQRFPDSKH